MNIESKRIIKVLVALSGLLISVIIYLSYFEIFRADHIVGNNYNKRQWINEEYVLRGMIVDRNGKILAKSEKVQNGQVRQYPFGNLYSHTVGYSDKAYGKSGLESSYNEKLLNMHGNNPFKEMKEKITGPRENGNNLILTVDHDLQRYAEQRLKGKKGAIILMNPKNGEIYTMVSKPDFDPSSLTKNWKDITEDQDSPLLNRATMGLYTPGSVFKVITATAALEHEDIKKKYACEGAVNIDGYILRDYKEKAHGEVGLEEAMVSSCNVAFSQIGLEVGEATLKNTAEKYMFNKIIPFDLLTKTSSFPQSGRMSRPELGASAIGQGKILTTPLNMVMTASAIANDGLMMKPILVKEVISPEGKTISINNSKILSRTSSASTAKEIKNMMIKVVQQGTGKNASIKNVTVAGKTGTAENESAKEHAWFIGFAPAEDPKLAIAVVLENIGSTGGTSAAPIARDILITALKKLK
ncbi:penicillin-binding transpeptidase domain-containing protein [Clostridiaceae bacterium 35-E11]